ncbi:MAG: U32 family peptidase C-terminal domain-containing protein [Coriobacteriales bacterium]|nr:U32 family peptidase C-terminal domain-containing protein [Coriobacteriales bacterium]
MDLSTRHSSCSSLELLSPAGGWEQLRYAVWYGANAVYLATEQFGMRKRASNFKMEELPSVVAFAHEHGVKVHLACNIVMHNSDIAQLPPYLKAADAAGVDALIISDLGAFTLAKQYAPHADLHVSTQASIANSQAACAWYNLGAKRIVCAREMSVAQIAELRANTPQDLEIEVFAHGSMCMAYAGRCLISDYLTGRSANNGHCTQACRWAWSLHEPSRPGQDFPVEEDEDATYIFNSCDLNMLAHLDDLAQAGVMSIKLEGRGRKAYYVAAVTNAYRRVIDGEDPALVEIELETVSHHPYSTGFFYGPAHQAPYSDAASSDWLWVAAVDSCKPLANMPGYWEADVTARNRFDISTPLELLSPGKAAAKLSISNLRLIVSSSDGNEQQLPTDTANRQMDHYRFICNQELHEHDIIRTKKE